MRLIWLRLHQHDEAGAGHRATVAATAEQARPERIRESAYGWDYLYEPDAKSVIDDLLTRYVEAIVYQEQYVTERSYKNVTYCSPKPQNPTHLQL
jgi:hypothetical protein